MAAHAIYLMPGRFSGNLSRGSLFTRDKSPWAAGIGQVVGIRRCISKLTQVEMEMAESSAESVVVKKSQSYGSGEIFLAPRCHPKEYH